MKTKRTKADYEDAVAKSLSIAGVCKYLGLKPAGGNYKLIHRVISEYNLDTSHFTGQGWNTGLKFKPRHETPIGEILKIGTHYQSFKLKNRLLKEGLKERVCEQCGLRQWMDCEIPLELHHVNGDNSDNRLENLKLLCPNCHALTDNYRGLNKSAHRETGDVELP